MFPFPILCREPSSTSECSAQLGEKTNWSDSEDLAMMFQGAYTDEFYRALHDALHAQVDAWHSGPTLEHRPKAPRELAAALWKRVMALEKTCRNPHPTVLHAFAGDALVQLQSRQSMHKLLHRTRWKRWPAIRCMDLLLTHGYFLYEDPKELQIMKPYPPLGFSISVRTCGRRAWTSKCSIPRFLPARNCSICLEGPPSVLGVYANLDDAIERG